MSTPLEPEWAAQMVADVSRGFGIAEPNVEWRRATRKRTHGITGSAPTAAPFITVWRNKSDSEDFVRVLLLHELAHVVLVNECLRFLDGVAHDEVFQHLFYDLVETYGLLDYFESFRHQRTGHSRWESALAKRSEALGKTVP